MSLDPTDLNKRTYFVKYARIPVFSDPYIPEEAQKLRFCPYTRVCQSEKTLILAYFTQWHPRKFGTKFYVPKTK